MTALLNHPVTKHPCAFVASERGHVALRCDYVTPQVRWFKQSVVEAANPGVNVLAAFDSGLDYCYPQEAPPHQHWLDVQQARIEWNWKHVFIDADMLGKFSAGWEGADTEKSIGVRLCPRWKPAPVISLYAEALRAA